MPVTPDAPAPYGPASAVLDLIDRHRSKGLPNPVSAEVLQRAGISDSLVPRVLQTLTALDLIEEDGRPSEALEAIRLAPETEYKQRLKEWLTSTYADALMFVDPETADETRIRDAFRSYKPVGQQGRMVSLFIALFRAAGVGPDKDKGSARKATQTPTRVRPPPSTKRDHGRRPPPANGGHAGTGTDGLPPALAGLLATLPLEAGWTHDKRDQFVQAFKAVLDYCVPLIEVGTEEEEDEADA